MIKIYCIEDINDLKYVGSTTKLLCQRMAKHRYDKKVGKNVSSRLLNLEYCIIYVLEECEESERKEKEKYWINEVDCVNQIKYDFDEKEWNRKYSNKYYHTVLKFKT